MTAVSDEVQALPCRENLSTTPSDPSSHEKYGNAHFSPKLLAHEARQHLLPKFELLLPKQLPADLLVIDDGDPNARSAAEPTVSRQIRGGCCVLDVD